MKLKQLQLILDATSTMALQLCLVTDRTQTQIHQRGKAMPFLIDSTIKNFIFMPTIMGIQVQ